MQSVNSTRKLETIVKDVEDGHHKEVTIHFTTNGIECKLYIADRIQDGNYMMFEQIIPTSDQKHHYDCKDEYRQERYVVQNEHVIESMLYDYTVFDNLKKIIFFVKDGNYNHSVHIDAKRFYLNVRD